jgi:hypothetical protein
LADSRSVTNFSNCLVAMVCWPEPESIIASTTTDFFASFDSTLVRKAGSFWVCEMRPSVACATA